ncbi:gamma-aminobutyric acid receptor subunit alpha-2-like isoform X1 [Gigantopelta aegis]|uniref:gamma-aminobutyric acid receptor subunit alpha-2-like isoform X1 n=1 Tax=Gigantopelta aegis TaxID=1735272 RepID=UPI001B88C083|nr:gamma-aminobutyric acid receptor subunit alpha-2-like isoform X1 [Gigantopelta aegis]
MSHKALDSIMNEMDRSLNTIAVELATERANQSVSSSDNLDISSLPDVSRLARVDRMTWDPLGDTKAGKKTTPMSSTPSKRARRNTPLPDGGLPFSVERYVRGVPARGEGILQSEGNELTRELDFDNELEVSRITDRTNEEFFVASPARSEVCYVSDSSGVGGERPDTSVYNKNKNLTTDSVFVVNKGEVSAPTSDSPTLSAELPSPRSPTPPPGLQMGEQRKRKTPVARSRQPETTKKEVNFSCISAEFKLTRLFGYYVAQVYVPSILIVMLSWVSFWIDIDAIPARVSLGLLTVLTMTTHSTGVHSMLPRVSYIKAIDVWMAACLIFVFAALLEFAYVNVQTRVEKRRRESVMDIKQNKDRGVKSSDHYCLGSEEVNWNKGRTFVYLRDRIKMQRARMFDKISRVVFPILFGIFNVAYWLLYRM